MSNIEPMTGALWITLIGMGLVFAVIILLWAFMAGLVKLTSTKPQEAEEEPAEETAEVFPDADLAPAAGSDLLPLKLRAAAAAVAAALALDARGKTSRLRPTEALSPWQAALRAVRFDQRNSMYTRKTRGTQQ